MRLYVYILLFSLGFLQGQYRDIPEVVTKVATSAANWLKLETSARAIGMGGAFVASGRGVSGIPYNPASIAFIESREAYFSSVNYLAGVGFEPTTSDISASYLTALPCVQYASYIFREHIVYKLCSIYLQIS